MECFFNSVGCRFYRVPVCSFERSYHQDLLGKNGRKFVPSLKTEENDGLVLDGRCRMTISQQIVQSLRTDSQVADSIEEEDEIFDIDQHLKSSSKKVLLQKINFVEAKLPYHFSLKKLKSKYVLLNPSQDKSTSNPSATMSPALKVNSPSVGESAVHDGIPPPKMTLFSAEKIDLCWKKAMRAGAGLSNLGNTCFLNSALQCLAYTAPLANYLIHLDHKKHCRVNGQFCMLCAMQQHIYHIHSSSGQAVKPMHILKNLRMIAKHLQFGRQEDAHEFIRYSVDAMQKSCLFGYSSKMDVHIKATTAVHQIFGGYLRSRVKCMQCKSVSDTYDPFLDLSLDINKQGCVNLQRCLELFVRIEILQGDNAYKCMQCKNTVQACKKFSIHRPPNVLMLQLKRFSNFMGSKINKDLAYPSKLNIAPYMSNRPDGGYWYELYAVLVHSGYSCQSGHYYAYAKASNGQWYCFNDSSVHQVSVNQALSQQAYLLFYLRNPKASTPSGNLKISTSFSSNSKVHSAIVTNGIRTNGSTDHKKSPHRPVIGPQLPSNFKPAKEYSFQSTSSSKDTGMLVTKQFNQPKMISSVAVSKLSNGESTRKPLQFSIDRKSKLANVANAAPRLTNGGQTNPAMVKSNSFASRNGEKVQSVDPRSSSLPGTSSSSMRSPIFDQFLNDSAEAGTSSSSVSTSHSSLSTSSLSVNGTMTARKSLVSYSSEDSDDENDYDTPLKTDYTSLTSTLKGLRAKSSTSKDESLKPANGSPQKVNGKVHLDKNKNSTKPGTESCHEPESPSKTKASNAAVKNCDEHRISSGCPRPNHSNKPDVERHAVGNGPSNDQCEVISKEKSSQREPILHLLNNEIENGIDAKLVTKEKADQKYASKHEDNDNGKVKVNGHDKSEREKEIPVHDRNGRENGFQEAKDSRNHDDDEVPKARPSSEVSDCLKPSKDKKPHHSTETTSFTSPEKENKDRHKFHNGKQRKRSPSPSSHKHDRKSETLTKKRKRNKSDRRQHSDGYDSDDSYSHREKHHKSKKQHRESPQRDHRFFPSGLKRSHAKANWKYSDDTDSSVERLYCDKKQYEQSLRRKAKKDKKRRLKEREILQNNIDRESPKSDHRRSSSRDRSRDVDVKERPKKCDDHFHNSTKSSEKHGEKRHHEQSENHRHEKKVKKDKAHENGKGDKKHDKKDRDRQKSPAKDRPNILQQLLRQSSGKAYGAKVETWNGEDSLVEKDARQTWSQQRNPITDEWDREYDKGKVKKHKKKDHHYQKSGPMHNIFQKFQNMKNQRNGA